MTDERRGYPRYAVDLPCVVGTDDGDVPGRIVNVSRSGAMILTEEGYADVGDLLSLRVEIPGEAEAQTLRGEVMRVFERDGRPALGVLFSNGEQASLDTLWRFIDRLQAGSPQQP